MTLKDKLIIYLYHKGNEIERETELLYDMRFHKMDSLDLYELMRRKVYVSVWQSFLNDLYKIVFTIPMNDTKRK